MSDSSAAAIICGFDPQDKRWFAYFKQRAHVTFRGEELFSAANRLLEGTGATPGEYIIRWDEWELLGPEAPFWVVAWQPPELLHECPDCVGNGHYVGMADMEVCQTCGGRKVIRLWSSGSRGDYFPALRQPREIKRARWIVGHQCVDVGPLGLFALSWTFQVPFDACERSQPKFNLGLLC